MYSSTHPGTGVRYRCDWGPRRDPVDIDIFYWQCHRKSDCHLCSQCHCHSTRNLKTQIHDMMTVQ